MHGREANIAARIAATAATDRRLAAAVAHHAALVAALRQLAGMGARPPAAAPAAPAAPTDRPVRGTTNPPV